MKISVVSRGEGWHVDQIRQAAKEKGCAFEVVNFTNLNRARKKIKTLGEVVLWRASSLDILVGRTTFLTLVDQTGRFIINHAILKTPTVAHKLYQQKIVEKFPTLTGVKTYSFKSKRELLEAIDNGELKYPFIQKAGLGARGQKVSLVKKRQQVEELRIKFKDYLFQNFVKNSGDYRVLVLGGRALGVMKRTAAPGEFRNNVSLGGIAAVEEDPEVLGMVKGMATSIASLFDLTICGVDIIYDENEGIYRFLEVNTAPQWRGFQEATGINVAAQLVRLCKDLVDRREKPTNSCIQQYYDSYFDQLDNKKFHYASRMYLWTGLNRYRKILDDLKLEYLGRDKKELAKKLAEIIDRERNSDTEPVLLSKKLRKKHFDKYPLLPRYNRLLFKTLFAETIYGENIRSVVANLVSKSEFLRLKEQLIEDGRAIATLSTHAVNYFYLLANYLKGEKLFEPEFFLRLAKRIDEKENDEMLRFKIYLLTHCIIGESKFYQQKIKRKKRTYLEMVKMLEKIIFVNYFKISLDNKFEFLVCARMCTYKSFLEDNIMAEADRSWSSLGNYLVDRLNDRANQVGNKFVRSEHRNVLYLMASADKRLWVKLYQKKVGVDRV